MGNAGLTFNIGYTRSKKLNRLNSKTCDNSLERTKVFLEKLINKVKKINDYTKTRDYEKYGIYPGQQIRRRVKGMSVAHAAIYIYNGYILEFGSSTRKCSKKLGHPSGITEQINGLSTINSFRYHARKSSDKDVYIVETGKDSDKETIAKRLDRCLEIVGKTKYHYLLDNCLHAVNYVSYGKKTLANINNLRTKKIGSRKSRRSIKK